MLSFWWPLVHRISTKSLGVLLALSLLSTLLGAARTEAQVPISFGQTIPATISNPAEVDAYSFNANAGDVILVMLSADAGLNPEIQLHLLDDTWEASVSGSGPDTVLLETEALPANGTYSLTVSDSEGTGTGDYWLFVQRVNSPGGATQISFGETQSTSIQSVHEVDTYTFDALAGDVVLIQMSPDQGLDPEIWIYGPDGSMLDGFSRVAPYPVDETYELSSPGTYTLLAFDAADLGGGDYGKDTGDYWFFVQRVNNPEGATQIDFGQTLTASIQSVHEMDTYTFDALAGDVVLIRMNPDPGLDPEIRIYGPDGSYLHGAATTSPYPVDEDFELTSPGTYTVIALDSYDIEAGDYGMATGNYWLYVQRVNNPGGATKVNFGETLPASINVSHEADTYTFDAFAGDVVIIRMSTDTGLDPSVMIYGPDGCRLDWRSTTGPSILDEGFDLIPPPEDTSCKYTGTYTVIALDSDDIEAGDYGMETGNYWLYLQRVNNPEMATQIDFGETLSASLDDLYEVDTYTFDALEGDEVLIRMSTDTGLDPEIRLYDANGETLWEVAITGPGTAEIMSDPLLVTGSHTVLALNSGTGRETGPYSTSLSLLSGNPGSLAVSPSLGLHASGLLGGPFAPLSLTYTLENRGTDPIDWTLSKTLDLDWLDISSMSGTVAAGGSDTVVVSIKADMVQGFPEGIYAGTLTFTNLTEANRRIIRSVSLKVDPIEGILQVTPSDNFSPSGPPFDPSSITYTLKNTGQKSMTWRAGKTAFWLSLSNDHGTLAPDESVGVTVSPNEIAAALAKGVYQDTVTFTNTSNGYGDTTRKVTLSLGINPSEITAELSRTSMILGDLAEPLQISGRITPEPCEGGAWVDVALISPGGKLNRQSVSADADGNFTYPVACGDINSAGTWIVRTSWVGDSCSLGATSAQQSLVVTKAESRTTVDAGSRAVKLGDLVDISGKFTPDPDCGRNLTGRQVKLVVFGPGGRSDIRTVITNDRFGHFVLQDYSGFNALGLWSVQALFLGDEAYEESSSEVITVQVVETAGYAVIVQGKIQNEEGLASHNKTTNLVYEQLKLRGFLDEDIYYLNFDHSQEGVDAIPSKTAVEYAITQWARDKMNAKPANLYLVAVDHGLTHEFYIYPEVITAADLGSWVDRLQADLEGQAAVQEILVLLGFCRSGSFLEELGGWNRVVIASAAADESSYKGPLDPGDTSEVRDGEFFITEFFKAAAVGKDVLSSFEEAVHKTELFTSKGTGETNAPYSDDSRQHPLLDDNGDGVGENNPSGDPGQDGYLSRELSLGVSTVTGNAPGDVQVSEVGPTQLLAATEDTASFWARVDDNTRMRSLWVEVKPPLYEPGPGGTEQIEMDLPGHAYDAYNEPENRYVWNSVSGFTEPGTYQLFFFARDDLTGNESSLKQAIVYKAREGNSPPGSFALLSPADSSETRTVLVLDWADSTDPDGDPITYTVEISEDVSFATVAHRAERLGRSHYLVSDEAGLKDLTTYHWRVTAVDFYGASTVSTEVWSFSTNNTNPLAGWIAGRVYNATTEDPISSATVSIGGQQASVLSSGDYIGLVEAGTYTVTASAAGFDSKSYPGVVIRDAEMVTKDFALAPATAVFPGDIDGDFDVDLADAILAFQVMAGIQPSTTIYLEGEVNDDSKIGLEEVIYIMQKEALLRE